MPVPPSQFPRRDCKKKSFDYLSKQDSKRRRSIVDDLRKGHKSLILQNLRRSSFGNARELANRVWDSYGSEWTDLAEIDDFDLDALEKVTCNRKDGDVLLQTH